jgi:uncharacterized protein YdcH (DUF465 family)
MKIFKDPLDTPPQGTVRTKKGRIKPTQNPTLVNLKKENVVLKDRLSQLEELVSGLTNKKGKK